MVVAVHEEAEMALSTIELVHLIELNANSGEEFLVPHGPIIVGCNIAPGLRGDEGGDFVQIEGKIPLLQ